MHSGAVHATGGVGGKEALRSEEHRPEMKFPLAGRRPTCRFEARGVLFRAGCMKSEGVVYVPRAQWPTSGPCSLTVVVVNGGERLHPDPIR